MVELGGYTDSVGPREYNLQLSYRRVEAVRRYLATTIPLTDIGGFPSGGAN